MAPQKNILSDSRNRSINARSQDSMETEKKEPVEWLENHEKRISVLEEGHDCKQEDRISKIESDKKAEREELERRDRGLKKAFDKNTKELKEIKEIVINLDKEQALTDQHNGFQDKQINGINEKEKESIRNRWVAIGLIIGSFVGPIVIKLVEYFTFL